MWKRNLNQTEGASKTRTSRRTRTHARTRTREHAHAHAQPYAHAYAHTTHTESNGRAAKPPMWRQQKRHCACYLVTTAANVKACFPICGVPTQRCWNIRNTCSQYNGGYPGRNENPSGETLRLNKNNTNPKM
eukprot:3961758-Amphidinium_carterae.1